MLQAADVRVQLEQMLSESVFPIAKRYDFSTQNLTQRTNWKPIVLLIGNYSSGKSTLINELLGGTIQRTGQAPTDDCFTVIVGPDDDDDVSGPVRVLEEVPGSTLVNDTSMPFTGFNRFGSRFVSHLIMKKVNSPKLKNLAIIDSPGMLDSVTELDRGYHYQDVVGRLAELADLVVLVFDPHRAGTIKETYVSIRSTLPEATSEDRVVFVMNRIDECKNLTDLLNSYGVLCWNLSQMTGRKDIPRIYMTYSAKLSGAEPVFAELADGRSELIQKIEQAPMLQVSHLLGTVDNYLHKLELIARTLGNASRKLRRGVSNFIQWSVGGGIVAVLALDSLAAIFFSGANRGLLGRIFSADLSLWAIIFPALLCGLIAAGLVYYFRKQWYPNFHAELIENLDECAQLDSRYARDLWETLRPTVVELINDPRNLSPLAPHRAHAAKLRKLIDEDVKRLYELYLGRKPRLSQSGPSLAGPSTPAPSLPPASS